MNICLVSLTSCVAMFIVMFAGAQIFGKNSQSVVRIPKLKRTSKRQEWLTQARVRMTPGQFWLVSFSSFLLSFFLISVFSRTPLVSFVIAIGFAGVPYMFISKKRNDISRELINAWPDALRDVSGTISAGHSLSFALNSLAKTGPAPIASHMARFSALEKTIGFSAALEIVREEMNDATSDRIIEILIVANDRGGKIVREIIDDLIESTTNDITLADSIATESIEMKINSRAVVILPWCVLVLLTLSGGIFQDFYQSSKGAVVLLIGAIMSVVGLLILSKLTRTEIEPRVLVKTGAH